jgi:hypothetical protein
MDSCGQDPKDSKDPKGEDRVTGAETNLVEAGVYLYMGYIWISHPFSVQFEPRNSNKHFFVPERLSGRPTKPERATMHDVP